MRLLNKLLGGRPMTVIDFAFTDKVSGEQVYYWRDTFGRFWLATHRWAKFRVLVGSIPPYPGRARTLAEG